MRILFVTFNYPPKVGGMETLMSQLVKHLRSHADVHVLGPYAGEEPVVGDQGQITRPRRDGLVWFGVDALVTGARLLRGQNYDAVVAGGGVAAPMSYALGRLFGLPIAANVHGLDLVCPHPLYQWLVRTFLPRCDHVFAISRASRTEAIHRGVLPENISIVHPGLDFSEFERAPDVDEIREQYSLKGHVTLLSAGRLARRKGILEFVRHSLPTIVDSHPSTLFLIVGDNPADSLGHREDVRGLIDAEVDRLGLQPHVRMLGYVDRRLLVSLYHACDVFVLPAIQVPGDMEGFGIVLIEANAAGMPVVSTRLGGIPDAVEHGKGAILVEAGMWDDLSDAIVTLLSEESLRRTLGQCGRSRVRRRFDWPLVAERYALHIAELADKWN